MYFFAIQGAWRESDSTFIMHTNERSKPHPSAGLIQFSLQLVIVASTSQTGTHPTSIKPCPTLVCSRL